MRAISAATLGRCLIRTWVAPILAAMVPNDRLTPDAYQVGVCIEHALDVLDQMPVNPARNPALF